MPTATRASSGRLPQRPATSGQAHVPSFFVNSRPGERHCCAAPPLRAGSGRGSALSTTHGTAGPRGARTVAAVGRRGLRRPDSPSIPGGTSGQAPEACRRSITISLLIDGRPLVRTTWLGMFSVPGARPRGRGRRADARRGAGGTRNTTANLPRPKSDSTRSTRGSALAKLARPWPSQGREKRQPRGLRGGASYDGLLWRAAGPTAIVVWFLGSARDIRLTLLGFVRQTFRLGREILQFQPSAQTYPKPRPPSLHSSSTANTCRPQARIATRKRRRCFSRFPGRQRTILQGARDRLDEAPRIRMGGLSISEDLPRADRPGRGDPARSRVSQKRMDRFFTNRWAGVPTLAAGPFTSSGTPTNRLIFPPGGTRRTSRSARADREKGGSQRHFRGKTRPPGKAE